MAAISVFVFTLIKENRRYIHKRYINLYADLYFWHLLILTLLEKLLDKNSKQWLNLKPFLVIGITCTISILLSNIKMKLSFIRKVKRGKGDTENGM